MAREGAIAAAVGAFLLFCLGFLIGNSPRLALVIVWLIALLLLVLALWLHIRATLEDSLTRKPRRS